MAFTDDINWAASIHTISGLVTTGDVTLTGEWADASPTTGEQSGTAGAGTTTTSCVKPGGADDWTADEMRGWFLRITGGGGAPAIRPILDNDTTTITVHAITGMDNTSEFEISIHDTDYDLTNITISDNTARIIIENCIIAKLTANRCNRVLIRNCKIDTSDSDGSLDFDDCKVVTVQECYFENSASATAERCNDVSLINLCLEDAWLNCVACNKVTADINAETCDATALHLEQCLTCFIGVEANGNTDSPCHFEGCNYLEPYSVGFIGTNAGSDYAIEIEKGGHYDLTAGTMTGNVNDLYIEANAFSWANLGSYKNIIVKGVIALTTA